MIKKIFYMLLMLVCTTPVMVLALGAFTMIGDLNVMNTFSASDAMKVFISTLTIFICGIGFSFAVAGLLKKDKPKQ